MAIKPLQQKNDNSAFIRVGLLIFVIGLGYFISAQPKGKNIPVNKKAVNQLENIKQGDIKEQLNKVADDTLSRSQDFAGQIMGEATEFVNGFASKSAETVSSFIIEKTTEPIIDQIEKLSPERQAEIKKAICE
ncbi:MAG: hypothetical protein Q8M94_06770 [Ignavibacteria bacterium]|nr:hypothetical protein [Ignavibacteria bacterium]